MTITYYDDGPDNLGRRSFCLDWVESDGTERGQVFFCNPAKYEEKIKEKQQDGQRNQTRDIQDN
jgi:hypothetical protein